MILEVDEHRGYTKKQIIRWEKSGDLTSDQAERFLSEMDAHLEDVEPPPHLTSGLDAILTAWQSLGRPCAVISGLAGGILDNRGQLYIARLSWLDEHLYVDQDDRDAATALWFALDREEIRLTVAAVNQSSSSPLSGTE